MTSAEIVEKGYSFPAPSRSKSEKVTHDIREYLRNLCSFAAKHQPLVYLDLWESKRYSQVVEVMLMRAKERNELLERIEEMDFKYAEQFNAALLIELLLQ